MSRKATFAKKPSSALNTKSPGIVKSRRTLPINERSSRSASALETRSSARLSSTGSSGSCAAPTLTAGPPQRTAESTLALDSLRQLASSLVQIQTHRTYLVRRVAARQAQLLLLRSRLDFAPCLRLQRDTR